MFAGICIKKIFSLKRRSSQQNNNRNIIKRKYALLSVKSGFFLGGGMFLFYIYV